LNSYEIHKFINLDFRGFRELLGSHKSYMFALGSVSICM
jgi:hypothetical protein